jgi:hypothetical protein
LDSMDDSTDKKVVRLARVHVGAMGPRPANAGMFTKDRRPENKGGRPPGALNKLTRSMKDAAVAAAVELGEMPRDQWEEAAKQAHRGEGMKGFFMNMIIEQPKSFMVVIARIMPLHVGSVVGDTSKWATREQSQARLREAGLPENLVDFMKPVDVHSLDPGDLAYDPYDYPDETDDEDVTPEQAAE